MTGVAMSGSGSYVVDPARGIAYEHFRFGDLQETVYAVAGKGLYRTLPDPRSRAAVKMMGRPTVKYVFTLDKSLTLAAHLKDNAPTPAAVLSGDVHHAGTKTVHDDGSADYTQVVDGETVTLRVSPAGTLSGLHARADGYTATLTYTYGPQKLTAPAANTAVGEAQLARGVWYLGMRAHVREASHIGAAKTRRAARGATVKVASLRKTVRREVAALNTEAQLKTIKVKNVRRGVRVYATNPWTHKTVSYTVKASGKKVLVQN